MNQKTPKQKLAEGFKIEGQDRPKYTNPPGAEKLSPRERLAKGFSVEAGDAQADSKTQKP